MTIEPLTPERRRQQTRDHLLEAAARVFGERGYHGASLDDIAAAAGFTKGAVYSNFKSKEDLFLALLESRFASELEDLKAALSASDVGPGDRLSDFVTLIVEQPNDPARVTWFSKDTACSSDPIPVTARKSSCTSARSIRSNTAIVELVTRFSPVR